MVIFGESRGYTRPNSISDKLYKMDRILLILFRISARAKNKYNSTAKVCEEHSYTNGKHNSDATISIYV